jgi:hypothetical protein
VQAVNEEKSAAERLKAELAVVMETRPGPIDTDALVEDVRRVASQALDEARAELAQEREGRARLEEELGRMRVDQSQVLLVPAATASALVFRHR